MARKPPERAPYPHEVALEAWRTMESGQTKLLYGNRVTRLEKMVLVTQSFENWMVEAHNYPRFHIRAFPKPEHMEDFKKTSYGVRDAGPSEGYGRQAIGTLDLEKPAVQGPAPKDWGDAKAVRKAASLFAPLPGRSKLYTN